MSPVRRLADLDPATLDRLLVRGRAGDAAVARSVAADIADVRARGDDALRDLARRYDGVALDALDVPRSACDEALRALDPALRDALQRAADAIRRFHAAQRPTALVFDAAPGLTLGRRPDPLRRVGVYAPGGRAAYPSSVLMGVVPARVAGVEEVVVCSPPACDGRPSPLVMAACAVAGADRLFALGGAGAVAALALGTPSVRRVDRVVGPGNAYVAEAKRQLSGEVGTDAPAGPSELLVVADAEADPAVVALELLAQAEHDPDAAAVLVSTDGAVAAAVAVELDRRARDEPRAEIVRASLAAGGALLLADDLDAALAFAERYAPEHLLLLVDSPRAALPRVRAAGTVFLGPSTSVTFGDYATGANHVLPTGGLARAWSGLALDDFFRWTTWQEATPAAAADLARTVAPLAEAEGLPAHAAAARRAAAGGAGARRPATGAVRPAPAPRAAYGEMAPRAAYPAPAPRAAYRELAPYDPARPPLPLDLSANTNLWGPCPAALDALRSAKVDAYPTPYADALKRALAERWGLAPEQVTTGCGSDDVLDSTIRAFCDPSATVAYVWPTFGMAAEFARLNGARPVPVEARPGGGGDGGDGDDALAELAAADVAYLCRPENPTGEMMPRERVLALLERARGLVLIDEAYGEFAGESLLDAALASGRAVVVRTLSKAYGLAGLRVGYALGPAPLVRAIELSRGPYKVGAAAEAAAVAAVREGGRWVADVVRRTAANRARLAAELRGRGLRVLDGSGNFLLVRPGAAPAPAGAGWAAAVKAGLAARGIGVRAFPALPGHGDALRVTVGPWAAMERFLEALDALEAVPGRDVSPAAGREVAR